MVLTNCRAVDGANRCGELTARPRVDNIRLMMQLFDPTSEEQSVDKPRRNELLVETLKVVTPALGLLLFLLGLNSKYSWLSKPWITDALVVLGIVIVGWFAKPRFSAWLRKLGQRKRDRLFVATTDTQLREFVEQFAEFISNNNTRSLICIVRSGFPQNTAAAEQILAGDYIGSWFHAYREQLAFPTKDWPQFLARCREFGNIVQQFNSYYVLRAQRQLAAAVTPLPEHNVAELEGFREEYNAFLRDLEPWAKGIANYLQSLGVAEQPAQWRFAPTSYFERAKSFNRTKSVGG
jgi:hypothetical protein